MNPVVIAIIVAALILVVGDANLGGANLRDANLRGAYLRGATGNEWTRLPAGYRVNDSGLIVRDGVS